MPRNKKQVDDLAAEQRRATRLKFRRKALVILAGVVVLSIVAGNTTWFEPDTLLKPTVTVGDATYVCRIIKKNGELRAEWSRRAFLGRTGRTDTAHLGFIEQIGTDDPKIALDGTGSRIVFEIGGAKSIVRPGL